MTLILYIIAIIGLWIGFQWLKNRRIKSRQTKDFVRIFGNAQIKLPNLEIGTTYWWTTFSITFSTKEEMEFAEQTGLVEQFKERIKTYFDKEFDPNKAIYCTYIGHVPSWKTMVNEMNGNKQ